MGRQILPSISKLEDVLDLLTDPEKYTKYLSEFKQVYDETLNILGVLDTKQKADSYLSDASAKFKAADLHAHEVEYKINAETLKLAAQYADLEEEAQSLALRITEHDEYHSRRESELIKKYAECQKYRDETFHELTEKQTHIDAMKAKLEIEVKAASALREKYEAVAQAIGLKVE